MYPNSEVEGKVLTKVSWYEKKEYYDSDIIVSIYSGSNTPTALLAYHQYAAPIMSGGFHELTLPDPVQVKSGENLWIMLLAMGTKVISYCKSNEPNNQWIYKDGSYCHLSDLNPDFASYGFMIRGYMETEIGDHTINWTTATCSEPTYLLTGLIPETDYVAQVRGDYGEEGNSQWSTATFTTPKQNETGIDTLDNLTISPFDKLSDVWYDLSGRKIVKPSNGQMPKGIYINHGRKVVIK